MAYGTEIRCFGWSGKDERAAELALRVHKTRTQSPEGFVVIAFGVERAEHWHLLQEPPDAIAGAHCWRCLDVDLAKLVRQMILLAAGSVSIDVWIVRCYQKQDACENSSPLPLAAE